MQFRTKKQSFMGIWSGSVAVACLALILGFASTGYGDIIIGNFESADSNDGWVPGPDDPNAILIPDSNVGVTLGHGSLKLKPVADGAYWELEWAGSPVDLTGAQLQFDVTMIASEWPTQPWTKIADKIAVNSGGPSGWKEYNNLAVATDRDTGEATTLDWGTWAGDANKTYTLDISDYGDTGGWMQIHVSVQDNDVAEGGNFYFDNFRIVTPAMTVSKCKVTAGKTQYTGDGDYNDMKDSITASGTVALPPDINDINSVEVTITSLTDDEVIYTETLSDFDANVVNSKHKYTHTAKLIKGQEGKITSFKLDFRRGTFALTAKNVDLTGLACPFEIKFAMGSYELKGNAYETVVNGSRKTIPTRLMRLYDDTLIVTKAKAKHSTKALSDTLSVKGEIAVADMGVDVNEPNLAAEDVNITWRDANDANTLQTFTIPAGSFKAAKKGNKYKCSKINVDPGAEADVNDGIVAATIDLDKCTFTLTVKKADGLFADKAGEATFGINFATPDDGEFNEEDNYTLP